MDRGVGGEAAVAEEGLEPWFVGSHQPGVSRPHRVPVATETFRVDFEPRGQEIDPAAHIENVLPGHALTGHHVAQELEALIGAVSLPLVGILPFLEAQRIGTEHHVAFPGQSGAGVVHGTTREAGRFALTEVVLAVVLVPDRNAGCRVGLVDPVGNEQHGRDVVVHFRFVRQRLDAIALLLNRLAMHGIERTGLRPRAAQAGHESLPEFVGALHGREFRLWWFRSDNGGDAERGPGRRYLDK